jgi:hypothetical protein
MRTETSREERIGASCSNSIRASPMISECKHEKPMRILERSADLRRPRRTDRFFSVRLGSNPFKPESPVSVRIRIPAGRQRETSGESDHAPASRQSARTSRPIACTTDSA